MQIFLSSQRLMLLEYMARLKFRLPEWLIVELRLINSDQTELDIAAVADLLNDTFGDYEGRILICTATEALMLIEWGKDNSPQKLAKKIGAKFPAEVCETKIETPTKEGVKRIEIKIGPAGEEGTLYAARMQREGNVFLIADDDMYIRSLVKKALQGAGTIFEMGEGHKVLDTYKVCNPDIVLLDIHMPGLNGPEVLIHLKELDPSAYIIMLSADSTPENVQSAHQHGAKGFLAKPFNKARLLEYVEACPTTV
jgi:CheY-like chemotaxis protein